MFTVLFPSLITVEFLLFIKSQFATNVQNILHLNHCTHGRVWWLTVIHFQSPAAVSNVLNSSERRGWCVHLFQIGAGYTRVV